MTVVGKPGRIKVGQIWREAETGRLIRILQTEVYGTDPAWTYCDEPDGWCYCSIFDFWLWNRFEFVE